MRRQRAFTLVEILMVVLILAISSAIIIPQMGTRDDLKAASAARVIMADLIWAQNRAIATQQKQYIVITGQSYTLWYKDSTGTLVQSTNPVTQSVYTTTFGVSGTPLGEVSIGTADFAGQTSLCFDEMGTPKGWNGSVETDMTSSGSVQVSCGDQKLTITVEGYTGETSVQ
jgi:prepilin-type N-terminal cleavage/methylation domain-containing protein